jgi:hypothetical protein
LLLNPGDVAKFAQRRMSGIVIGQPTCSVDLDLSFEMIPQFGVKIVLNPTAAKQRSNAETENA